jgi:hypothetical protein
MIKMTPVEWWINDVNGKWDDVHPRINIGSHANMGHVVGIIDIS